MFAHNSVVLKNINSMYVNLARYRKKKVPKKSRCPTGTFTSSNTSFNYIDPIPENSNTLSTPISQLFNIIILLHITGHHIQDKSRFCS